MSRGLATRLRRLEKLHRPRCPVRFVLFAIQLDVATGPIIGLSTLDRTIARLNGEDDLLAFAERASVACNNPRIMFATYAREPAPVATVEPPRPVLAAPVDPFAAAGIGRVDERYLGWHPANAGMIEDGTG